MSGNFGLLRWLRCCKGEESVAAEAAAVLGGGRGGGGGGGGDGNAINGRGLQTFVTTPSDVLSLTPAPPPTAPPPDQATLRRRQRSRYTFEVTLDRAFSLVVSLAAVSFVQVLVVLYFHKCANRRYYQLRRGAARAQGGTRGGNASARGGGGGGGGGGASRGGSKLVGVVPGGSPTTTSSSPSPMPPFRRLPTWLVWPNQQVAVVAVFTSGLVEGSSALLSASIAGDAEFGHVAFASLVLVLLVGMYAYELTEVARFASTHARVAWVPSTPPSRPSEVCDPALALLARIGLSIGLSRRRTQGEYNAPLDAGSEEPRRTEEAIKAWLSCTCWLPRCAWLRKLAADMKSDFGRIRKVKRTAWSGARQRRVDAATIAALASHSHAVERRAVWLRDATGTRAGCFYQIVQTILTLLIAASIGALAAHPYGATDEGIRTRLLLLLLLQASAALFTGLGTANDLWRGGLVCIAHLLECASTALVLEGTLAQKSLGEDVGTRRALGYAAAAASTLTAAVFLPVALTVYDVIVVPITHRVWEYQPKTLCGVACAVVRAAVMVPVSALITLADCCCFESAQEEDAEGETDDEEDAASDTAQDAKAVSRMNMSTTQCAPPRCAIVSSDLHVTELGDLDFEEPDKGPYERPHQGQRRAGHDSIPRQLKVLGHSPPRIAPRRSSITTTHDPGGGGQLTLDRHGSVAACASWQSPRGRAALLGGEGGGGDAIDEVPKKLVVRKVVRKSAGPFPPRPSQHEALGLAPGVGLVVVRLPGEAWGFSLGWGKSASGRRFYVVPSCEYGSVAQRCGLRVGDRVHAINGRDLSDGSRAWDEEARDPKVLKLRLSITRGEQEAEIRAEREAV